jgi:hypothetical protein
MIAVIDQSQVGRVRWTGALVAFGDPSRIDAVLSSSIFVGHALCVGQIGIVARLCVEQSGVEQVEQLREIR